MKRKKEKNKKKKIRSIKNHAEIKLKNAKDYKDECERKIQ